MPNNLHQSYDPEEIKTELLERGFLIMKVPNKYKKQKINEEVKLTNLPLFMLTFDNKDNNPRHVN